VTIDAVGHDLNLARFADHDGNAARAHGFTSDDTEMFETPGVAVVLAPAGRMPEDAGGAIRRDELIVGNVGQDPSSPRQAAVPRRNGDVVGRTRVDAAGQVVLPAGGNQAARAAGGGEPG